MGRLRQIRESNGLSREALAAKAGISREYVRLLESDHAPTPSLRVARGLAAALSLTVDELFPAADDLVVLEGPAAA